MKRWNHLQAQEERPPSRREKGGNSDTLKRRGFGVGTFRQMAKERNPSKLNANTKETAISMKQRILTSEFGIVKKENGWISRNKTRTDKKNLRRSLKFTEVGETKIYQRRIPRKERN